MSNEKLAMSKKSEQAFRLRANALRGMRGTRVTSVFLLILGNDIAPPLLPLCPFYPFPLRLPHNENPSGQYSPRGFTLYKQQDVCLIM